MSNPSSLGDLGYQISGVPAATSTASFIDQQAATDTGTIVASGRAIDLANPFKSTTGSLLDATVCPWAKAPIRQWRSVGIQLPMEWRYDASGRYTFLSIAHQHRSATSGAGSTWATIETGALSYRAGTSTQGIHHLTATSTVNAQAIKRYYKAVVTLSRKLTSSTSGKDTTTGQQHICGQPNYIFGGGSDFPAQE